MEVLSRNWGWIVGRGVLAILFGLLVLGTAATSLDLLVLLFGVYAFADGAASLIVAAADRRSAPIWIELLCAGIGGVGFGIAAFLMPRVTGLVVLALISSWALVLGVSQMIAAIRLRKILDGAWPLMLIGIASVVFSAVVVLRPAAAGLFIAALIASFSFCAGALQIVFGVRLRNWGRSLRAATFLQGARA
jgi:uncharacterized membrane protein HdeD (DUF308 family)